MRCTGVRALPVAILLSGLATVATAIELNPLASYETGIFDDGGAEIVAYDAGSQRVFFVNAGLSRVDVLDATDPSAPSLLFSIDATPYGASANSVAVRDGLVVVAVENDDAQANGVVVAFDVDGTYLWDVEVGALPDMVTFTPDGRSVLVANEGEPDDDYDIDPEGSVSRIDLPLSPGGTPVVTTYDLDGPTLEACADCRVFGPGATAAQDFEPEYIAVSADGRRAYVAFQENNALGILDLELGRLVNVRGLGFKDHTLPENAFDASNRSDEIEMRTWPVKGMYQPDAIATFEASGGTMLVSANEGDARDYDGYSEEERVEDLVLDPTAFPDAATLQLEENLGRLTTTLATGDTDGDGDHDEIYAYGARSISVWNDGGQLVWDSGRELEDITAAAYPDDFNSTNTENDSFKNRSDDKGPEPEGLVVGEVNGISYVFVGLERMGGVVVYDLSDPSSPSFVQYVNTRDYSGDPEAGTAGDLGPEGLVFVPAGDSPIGTPLLIVGYEISGTVGFFEILDPAAPLDAHAPVHGLNRPSLAVAATPFSTRTAISVDLPAAADASVEVYGVSGKRVATLHDGALPGGTHQLAWDGRSETGRPVAPGAYFVRLEAAGTLAVEKVVLAR